MSDTDVLAEVKTAPASRPTADESVRKNRKLLAELFGPPEARTFAVRLWEGTEETPPSPPAFTLVLRHPGALREMLLPPTERALGEAYLRGACDIEGDIESATGLADLLAARFRSPRRAIPLLLGLAGLPKPPRDGAERQTRKHRAGGLRHSPDRDRSAVRYHYDVSNDFYGLWLDERMIYSCGYFADGIDDLELAQEAKLELVCRKLRLKEGERLLDIGCGWGALVIHAAKHHGARAVGITLSGEQAALAQERIEEAGLGTRCTVTVRDYRELPEEERFDKIASIGMVEHVGLEMLPNYFREAFRLLKPGGLFLNHGIVHLNPDTSALKRFLKRRTRRHVSFIDRHVFPDSELMTPAAIMPAAEAAGFEMRDVESLREHYARTAREWVKRLEARKDEAVAEVGEPTYRVWRLYLAGSAYLFDTGRIGIIQTLLARRDASGRAHLPATRADLYRTAATSE